MFDDGKNESLEDDVRSFVDKTTHLTTAVLKRRVQMNTFYNNIYTDHRDLLSNVSMF